MFIKACKNIAKVTYFLKMIFLHASEVFFLSNFAYREKKNVLYVVLCWFFKAPRQNLTNKSWRRDTAPLLCGTFVLLPHQTPLSLTYCKKYDALLWKIPEVCCGWGCESLWAIVKGGRRVLWNQKVVIPDVDGCGS